MPYEHFPIQGVTPHGGGVEKRQEIDSWFYNPNNARQVALFVLALKKFQQIDPLGKDGKLSYYQIAGIHGQPMQPWDGAPHPLEGGPARDPNTQTGGYCTHNISTFPTWHRPYLLLFEQRIWEIMKEIIGRFENVDSKELAEWSKAAASWRLPYWDWSTQKVPQAVRTADLTIVAPAFRAENVAGTPPENPLEKFSNPTGKPMGDPSMENFKIPPHDDKQDGTYPWDRCISTSRWGVFTKKIEPNEEWVKGEVKDDRVDHALKTHGWYQEKNTKLVQGNIQAVMYRLFAHTFTSWEMFATTRYDGKSKKLPAEEFLSLEFVHNNIHNWAGGQDMSKAKLGAGHMSDVDVAAFDPIFYLHHCNVDRLLAIWQSLNPKLWFNKQHSDEPKPSDPLQPFHKDKEGSLWTSDACRDVKKLHYSYDDLEKPREGSIEAEKVDVHHGLHRSINKQYGSTRRMVLEDSNTTGLENDYIVNVVYDRFAYDGAPYTIYFFLGNPEEEGATCIGSVYNFSSSRRSQEGNCGNCQKQRANGILARALVPITEPLLHHAQSPDITSIWSLHPVAVEKYLHNHLQWRVVIGGKIIHATEKDVPGLTVFAMKGKAKHYKEDHKLSKFYNYEPIVPATRGKANGLPYASECPAAPLEPAHGSEL